MTVTKIWDGSGWVPIVGGQGPPGPQGIQGNTGPPSAVAQPGPPTPRNDIHLWIDTDEPMPAYVVNGPPIVSSLPAGPVDGQEIYYAPESGALGILWHLRFSSAWQTADGKGWQFLGGPELYAEGINNNGYSGTAYHDAAQVGPTITLPLAGDYDIAIGAWVLASGPNLDSSFTMSYMIGATAASDADAIWFKNTASNSMAMANVMRTRRKTGLAAVALKVQAKTSGGGWTAGNRFIKAKPVRVG